MDENSNKNQVDASPGQGMKEREVLFARFNRLKKEIGDLETALRVLNSEYSEKISKLQVQKQTAEQALFHVKALLKLDGYQFERESERGESPHESEKSQISIRDAVYELLREIHQPLHYKEITARLIAKNIKIPGKNSEATLLSRISRDRRFKRTKKRGTYTLAPPSATLPYRGRSRRRKF